MEITPCFSSLKLNLANCNLISYYFVSLLQQYSSSYPSYQAACNLSAERSCHLLRPPSKSSSALAPILILQTYSAFLACSLKPGAVPSFVTFPFSISAAHSAAPTVFVNANRILATGTISSNTAAIPKLTQAYQHIFCIPKPLN